MTVIIVIFDQLGGMMPATNFIARKDQRCQAVIDMSIDCAAASYLQDCCYEGE